MVLSVEQRIAMGLPQGGGALFPTVITARLLRLSGIEPATAAKVMRRAEIVARVRAGENPAAVAAALRVTNDTVRNACRIAGVPCRIPRDAHYARKTDILSARQAGQTARRK
jgi:hypothetical protein